MSEYECSFSTNSALHPTVTLSPAQWITHHSVTVHVDRKTTKTYGGAHMASARPQFATHRTACLFASLPISLVIGFMLPGVPLGMTLSPRGSGRV